MATKARDDTGKSLSKPRHIRPILFARSIHYHAMNSDTHRFSNDLILPPTEALILKMVVCIVESQVSRLTLHLHGGEFDWI